MQFHVRDLSEVLLERGHEVSVLAPADDDTPLPPYVVPAGSPSGGWSAQVTAVEGTEGVVTHTRTGGFIVPPLLPALRVTKSVQVLSDPVNGGVNPFQIPGSLQRYRVTVTAVATTGGEAAAARTKTITVK